MTSTYELAPRAIFLGDSIADGVYADSGVADPSKLWINRLPKEVGIQVNNLSSPGMTVASPGGSLYGLEANLNAITMAVGYSGAKWAIMTAGTNDTSAYGITLTEYIEAGRKIIKHCRSLGLKFIFISPIWRGDIAVNKPHKDGSMLSFEAYRVYGMMMAFEEKLLNGPTVHVINGLDANLQACHFIDDLLHLNESGQDVMFNFVVDRMTALGEWSRV